MNVCSELILESIFTPWFIAGLGHRGQSRFAMIAQTPSLKINGHFPLRQKTHFLFSKQFNQLRKKLSWSHFKFNFDLLCCYGLKNI